MSKVARIKKHLKLVISYEGTLFFGWQKNDAGPSIEEELEKTLFIILQEKPSLQAASRTDRGVHAYHQVVTFSTEKEIDSDKLKISLNQLLSKKIRVLSIETVDRAFHPTLSAHSKTYEYHVSTQEVLSPFMHSYCWHYPVPCELVLMEKAAKDLLGEKDFNGFTNFKKLPHKDTVREIFDIKITQNGPDFIFCITGNHFLYKMVRNIVGTLCYIGSKKLPEDTIKRVLSSKKRADGGMTAPACGLFLKAINYT